MCIICTVPTSIEVLFKSLARNVLLFHQKEYISSSRMGHFKCQTRTNAQWLISHPVLPCSFIYLILIVGIYWWQGKPACRSKFNSKFIDYSFKMNAHMDHPWISYTVCRKIVAPVIRTNPIQPATLTMVFSYFQTVSSKIQDSKCSCNQSSNIKIIMLLAFQKDRMASSISSL